MHKKICTASALVLLLVLGNPLPASAAGAAPSLDLSISDLLEWASDWLGLTEDSSSTVPSVEVSGESLEEEPSEESGLPELGPEIEPNG